MAHLMFKNGDKNTPNPYLLEFYGGEFYEGVIYLIEIFGPHRNKADWLSSALEKLVLTTPPFSLTASSNPVVIWLCKPESATGGYRRLCWFCS